MENGYIWRWMMEEISNRSDGIGEKKVHTRVTLQHRRCQMGGVSVAGRYTPRGGGVTGLIHTKGA